MSIYCLSSEKTQRARAQWFKADKYDDENRSDMEAQTPKDKRFAFLNINNIENGLFFIYDARIEDSGVYFCRINNASGPGTAVQIASKWLRQHTSSLLITLPLTHIFSSTGPVNALQALYRSRMKDGLIILQGLVLAGCIAAILLRKRQLVRMSKTLETYSICALPDCTAEFS